MSFCLNKSADISSLVSFNIIQYQPFQKGHVYFWLLKKAGIAPIVFVIISQDQQIFFATMQKPSKDNSGDKIYLKDPETGENALDGHGYLIVDHDLYQLSYKKQAGTIEYLPEGIAEAFIEFAKKEGISLFR